MVRYFHAWTPLVIVGTVVLLSAPWLGLIALMIVSLVALPALAFAIAFVPYMLIRAISRSWQVRSSASPRTAAVLSPATQAADRADRSSALMGRPGPDHAAREDDGVALLALRASPLLRTRWEAG